MYNFNIMELINSTDFEFVYTLDGERKKIFTSEHFYTFVRTKFPHMIFTSYKANSSTDIELAKEEFEEIFAMWKALNGDNFVRLWEALHVDYNPTDNYYKYEDGSVINEHHKGEKTTRTLTESGTETVEHHKGNTVTEDNSVNGFNSDTSVPAGSTTSTTKDISASVFDNDRHTFDGRQTSITETVEDASPTSYNKDVRSFDGRVTHGLIGDNSSRSYARLVTYEVEMRLKKYAEMILADFVNEYCWYAGGFE